jgi:hypothetical protein
VLGKADSEPPVIEICGLKIAGADTPVHSSWAVAKLHVVEEFFVHDLAIGDFVDGNFFHLEPSTLWLKSDIHLKRHREARATDERPFDECGVYFVVRVPPFAFGFHCRETFRFPRLSGRRASFQADDIGRVKLHRLVKLALGAELDQLVCNFVVMIDLL